MNPTRGIAVSVAIAAVIFPAQAEPLPGGAVATSKSEPKTAFSALTG